MIQPAAPSLLSLAPARSSPPAAVGGAIFSLPGEGGDDAALLAGFLAGGGGDRHDDAAPGNPLPTGVVPTPAPHVGEMPLPAAPLPPARSDRVALPVPVLPEPRSAKFDLLVATPPSRPREPDARTAGQDAAPDRDDDPARPDEPGAMPTPLPTADALVPMASATPVIDPPATVPPEARATIAEVPRHPAAPATMASAVPDEPPPLPPGRQPREAPPAAIPRAPVAASAPTAPPVASAGAGSNIVAASALATSSLTPLDAPGVVGTRAPASSRPASPISATDTTRTIVPRSIAATSTRPSPSGTPADAPVEPAGTPSPPPTELEGTTSTGSSFPITSSLPPSPATIAPVVPVRDVATLLAMPPSAAVAGMVAGISEAVGRPGERVSTVVPTIGRRPSPSSTVATTAPPPLQPVLPSNWQWAPRTAPDPAPSTASTGVGASTVTPMPVSIPLDRPIIPIVQSPARPTDATIGSTGSVEQRPDASVAVPPPAAAIVPPVAAAPAAVVFGAARFAARVADDRDEPAAPLGPVPLAAPQTIERAALGVAAPAGQPPLDLRQDHWPHAMIERIEMIRDAAADAADAVDTRIRLVPDALGAIDVEVKRDGDTLNVRFHAEQAQTRTLLADAAPRLAEAAEARGLRLGQSSVGTDAGSANQGQQRQPLPTAPPRAPRSPVADAHAADDDTRLA